MVNQSKIHLLRLFIITSLILPVIFPGSALALSQDFAAGTKAVIRGRAMLRVPQKRRSIERLAPLAGSLPSGTPFLPSLLVNTVDTSIWNHPSTDPAGIAYWSPTGKLLISDTEIEEAPQPFWDGFNVFQSTLTGSLSSNCTTFTSFPLSLAYNNFTDEPSGITFKPDHTHIFFSDDTLKKIFDVSLGLDNTYCTSDDTVTSVAVGIAPFNVGDPEDIAYGQNKLYIGGGQEGEVYVFDLGANGVLGGGDDSSGALTHFDTVALGFSDVEGIAYNDTDGTLYIVSTIDNDTYLGELTTSGTLLRAYDLSYLGHVRRSGLTVAPASTDPSSNNIYIVSRGVDNAVDPNNNDGKIWEIDITNPTMPDLIFKDGFESGDFSAWTSKTTNGGNLSVSPSAALFGSYGLRAVINNTASMYVTDDNPTFESRYRARFYFDPNSIAMGSDTHNIFQGNQYDPYTDTYNNVVFQVQLRDSGGYQIRGRILTDGGSAQTTSWYTITDASHNIEVDWSAATADGANDGHLTLWLDDIQKENKTGIDNDTRRVDRVRLGATSGPTVASGTYYFDAFESRRQSYIGPVVLPTVLSVVRADPNPTSAASVDYTVTFSESVTGVDTSDFTLDISGVSGPAVSGVSGSGAIYTVTVNTGTGNGMIRLDVLDNNSIIDTDGHFLDNGFTSGEIYDVIKGAEVEVKMGGSSVGNYDISPGELVSEDYNINAGPVHVESTNGQPVFTSQRAIYLSSFNSIVGYPGDQLTTDYWFTSYDDVGMATFLVIGNPDPALTAEVDVFIGGILKGHYSIAPGARVFPRYGINAGPVHVVSTNGVNIFTSERTKFKNSFNEVMGYPGDQLATEYWFTSYDDKGMITYLVVGNPSTSQTAEVDVYIGGNKMNTSGPIQIAPGQRVFPRYGINAGPVQVVSTNGVDIFTSERTRFGETFNEV
ncbi:MAG TPA: hypothetical protein VN843_23970, partial [Anaerolineales bacterium]|nr:hypothetical protein [Anaerolineales bacterium]